MIKYVTLLIIMLALSSCSVVVRNNFDSCIDYCTEYSETINRSCENEYYGISIQAFEKSLKCVEILEEQCYHECLYKVD